MKSLLLNKFNLGKDFKYFIFFFFTIDYLFSIIPFPLNIAINTILCLLLFYNNKSIHEHLSKKFMYWLLFTLAITFITLFYLICKGLNYGLDKNIKSIIINFYNVFFTLFLYIEFGESKFNTKIKNLFIIQLGIELLAFIKYLQYPTIHRFRGTFAEPVVMGFWLGIAIFILLLNFRAKIKYIFAIILIYILYFHCKAKFAMIAFPIALLVAFSYKLKKNKYFRIISIGFVLLLLLIYSIYSEQIIALFFRQISKHVPLDATNTFTTRFFYLLTSLKNTFIRPFGYGFGLEYEYYSPYFESYISLANYFKLDTSELVNYVNPDTIIEKESISVIIGHFGLVGLIIYIYNFVKVQESINKKKYLANALLLFVFIESCITMHFYVNILFIYAKIALNDFLKKRELVYDKYNYTCL